MKNISGGLNMKKFRMTALIAVFLLAAVCMLIPVSAESGYLRGDADGDGEITSEDLTTLLRTVSRS